MTCNPLLLARYLDNRLSGDELLDCLNHATDCQTCRQALMEVRRYERRDRYQKKKTPVPVPTGFGGAVLHQLGQVRLEPAEPGESLLDDTEMDDVFETAAPPKRVSHVVRPSLDWTGLIVAALRDGEMPERALAKAVHGCLCTVRRELAKLESDGLIVKRKGTRLGCGKAPNVWSLKPDEVCKMDTMLEKIADQAIPGWTWKNEVDWGNRVQKKNGLMDQPTEETMPDDKELELRVVGKLGERMQAVIRTVSELDATLADLAKRAETVAARVEEYRASLESLEEVREKAAERPAKQHGRPSAIVPAVLRLLAEAGELSNVEIAARLGKHRIRVIKSLRKAEQKGLVVSRQLTGQRGKPIVWSLPKQAKTA